MAYDSGYQPAVEMEEGERLGKVLINAYCLLLTESLTLNKLKFNSAELTATSISNLQLTNITINQMTCLPTYQITILRRKK